MPGIATHFEVLELAVTALGEAGLSEIANLIDGNPYAYLGAVGPALMDFISSDPPAAGVTPPQNYATVWTNLLTVFGGQTGLVVTLAQIQSIISELVTLANNQDCDGLKNLKDSGQLTSVTALSTQFATLLGSVETTAQSIFTLIADDLKPVFCGLTTGQPAPPPNQWVPRDFFSWKSTAKFAQALIARGTSLNDKRLLAYGYGYLIAYVASATGSPFVNSVVGGPPRTQWWRQRFVKNFIDAWVYGFYNSNKPGDVVMGGDSGDMPTPGYDSWSNLCNASLHLKIQLPGAPTDAQDFLNNLSQPFPQAVPPDFAANWYLAVGDAYGTVADLPPSVTAAGLNSAYLMTWLVLWFQTSGLPIGCNLTPPVGPPPKCTGTATNPFNFPAGGTPVGPPDPTPNTSSNTFNRVCGVILAILGGIGLLAGALPAGAALIAGAVDLLDCNNAENIDWAGFQCKLFWFQMYMFNGLVGLQQMLSIAGFTYPNAAALALASDQLTLAGITLQAGASINLVTSSKEGREQPFPSKCWDTSNLAIAILTFNQAPTATSPGFENPPTIAYIAGYKYPSWFIDDRANPLAAGEVKAGGGINLRNDPPGTATPFGNAVANCVDVFQNLTQKEFPNWNLDADRGLAYYCWQFDNGYDPNNVVTTAETP
jgi:hypothetical protein